MATYTNNLNLEKPDKTEQYSIEVFNSNAEKIDKFAGLIPPRAITADKLTIGANINGVLFDGSNDIISGLGLYSASQTYNSTNIVYNYTNEDLKLFKSKKDNNLNNPLTDTNYWEAVKINGGLPIGTILSVTASNSYVPEGSLPCDGAEYTKAQFNDLWINYIETNYLNTCTYTEYESEIATNGQCAKFAVDADNLTFKVPTINKIIADVADTLGVRGNGITIGLTGIDGNGEVSNFGFRATNIDNVTSGLFTGALKSFYGQAVGTIDTTAGTVSNTPDKRSAVGLTTDASNSGMVTDVDKTYLELRYFVVVANGQINQSMMDWSNWASSLQGKMNADHSNDAKPYIVETSDESIFPSWYRIWSDGWCEQGGLLSPIGGEITATFLKPYRSVPNVFVNFTYTSTSSNATYKYIIARNVTITGFDITTYETNSQGTMWHAEGYILMNELSGGTSLPA